MEHQANSVTGTPRALHTGRLNRIYHGKNEIYVYDYAGTGEDVHKTAKRL